MKYNSNKKGSMNENSAYVLYQVYLTAFTYITLIYSLCVCFVQVYNFGLFIVDIFLLSIIHRKGERKSV